VAPVCRRPAPAFSSRDATGEPVRVDVRSGRRPRRVVWRQQQPPQRDL